MCSPGRLLPPGWCTPGVRASTATNLPHFRYLCSCSSAEGTTCCMAIGTCSSRGPLTTGVLRWPLLPPASQLHGAAAGQAAGAAGGVAAGAAAGNGDAAGAHSGAAADRGTPRCSAASCSCPLLAPQGVPGGAVRGICMVVKQAKLCACACLASACYTLKVHSSQANFPKQVGEVCHASVLDTRPGGRQAWRPAVATIS